MPASRTRSLALGFTILTATTYVLIVLGALVRAHGAGLACPDWPLCFGEVVPSFDLKVAFEWGHRALAGSISIGFVALSWLALRGEATRRATAPLLALTAAVLSVQILLGALTVWELLASWTVTSHLLVGNAFGVCLAFVARALFRLPQRIGEPAAMEPVPGALRGVLLGTLALLGLQMTLGGLVSSQYAGLACPDWPTCMNGEWFPRLPGFGDAQALHLLHRVGGYALLAALAASAWLARQSPGLRPLLFGALGLGLAQVGVGVANVLLRLPVEVTGLHSGLAAAIVLTVALGVAEAFRHPVAAPAGFGAERASREPRPGEC